MTTLTMVAFAANSLLNRAALLDGETGPAAFAAIRLVSGALFLALLVSVRHGFPKLAAPGRLVGVGALTVYILGFSFAYVALDAGVGALLLFGMVQVTMFASAVLSGDRPATVRWLGSALALAGLAWMVWPAGTVLLPMGAALLMGAAGIGWGVYSIVGRGAQNPLGETTANFILAAPIAA
ncbi:MAG: EamA family transporter, partial [Pseudomonadota bacterium]